MLFIGDPIDHRSSIVQELEALHKAESESRQKFEQELLKLKQEKQALSGDLAKEAEARKLAAKQAAVRFE